MIKPKRLKQGDTVRIVSPASGMWTRSELWRGIEGLESMGFHVQTGKFAFRNFHYLGGKDEERAADLMDAFLDPDVDAIVCSQGGYGSARLFPLLDFEKIRRNPKALIGYSDITSLHLMLSRLCAMVSFHGPGATGFERGYLTDYTKDLWQRALSGDQAIGDIGLPDPDGHPLVTISPGIVEAPLIGGNLSLVCASLGTPFEIDTSGKILFFEELDTEPWVMDHMLTHLGNADKLRGAAGIVIGKCSDCEPRKLDPGFFNQRSLEDILFEILAPLNIPVLSGLAFGHEKDKATLPLGIAARLDADAGKLTLLECATEASS